MLALFALVCFRKSRRMSMCLVAVLLVLLPSAAMSAEHPLDPLSREEITATVEVLKTAGKTREKSLLLNLELHEPPKSEVLRYQPGDDIRRKASVTVFDLAQRQTHQAIVDLKKSTVISWKLAPGVEPLMSLEEFEKIIPDAVRADKRWQDAIRRRGITDFDKIEIEPWPSGYFAIPEEEGRRIAKVMSYYRGGAVNFYARPIEGVVAVVDVASGKVLKVIDNGLVPIAQETSDLDPKSIGKQQPAPRPLVVSQPQGASFEVKGHSVRWQNWRFRFGLTPQEGLVLYTVGYEEGGKVRPVLYRASLSELAMIYADPGPAWFFRNVFDEGETGVGVLTSPQEPGADVPANARFFDEVLATERGQERDMPNAIALYERDGGILWKHNELEGGNNQTRRARELVLSSVATISNYDYVFNWIFHQDGVLEMEVQLTGIMEPQGIDPASAASGNLKHAQRVTRNIAAVYHQHFFNFRLDMDVDGSEPNSVVEMNTEVLPTGPANPYGRAFSTTETTLKTEQAAQRQLNLASNRSWKVVNPGVKNALGEPVGYMLMTAENSVPYVAPESFVRKRAGYMNAHLWATPYNPDERYAAGDYPYQSKGGEGLPKWTRANRSIEGKDIVLWYTMGVTHIPRPEEWPVMNVHRVGFKLVPSGFFNRNPALDVPPPEPAR